MSGGILATKEAESGFLKQIKEHPLSLTVSTPKLEGVLTGELAEL